MARQVLISMCQGWYYNNRASDHHRVRSCKCSMVWYTHKTLTMWKKETHWKKRNILTLVCGWNPPTNQGPLTNPRIWWCCPKIPIYTSVTCPILSTLLESWYAFPLWYSSLVSTKALGRGRTDLPLVCLCFPCLKNGHLNHKGKHGPCSSCCQIHSSHLECDGCVRQTILD